MTTKFFLKKYDFKILAYKSLQVFILFFLTVILFLGLFTYDEFDPSPFSVGDEKPNNLLGAVGANFSAILFFILMVGHELIRTLNFFERNFFIRYNC